MAKLTRDSTEAERRAATERVVEVEWIDSHSEHGWSSDVPYPGLIRSVGYVLRDDDTGLTLTESIDLEPGTSAYGCSMAIPRVAVRSVREFSRKKR